MEDTNNCQTVRVSGSLAEAGVLGVVVDEVELHREGMPTNQVFRTHLGPVAPVQMKLSEDIFVLQSSTSIIINVITLQHSTLLPDTEGKCFSFLLGDS